MNEMPESLSDVSEDADTVVGEAIQSLIPAPTRPYKAQAINDLNSALSTIAAMFGMDYEAEKYTSGVSSLSSDEVRMLAMVFDAASGYGQTPPMELSQITDDRAITAITAYLQGLSADDGFKAFLSDELEDEEPMTEKEPEKPAQSMKSMFMSRMS